jgi:hypothetical protein
MDLRHSFHFPEHHQRQVDDRAINVPAMLTVSTPSFGDCRLHGRSVDPAGDNPPSLQLNGPQLRCPPFQDITQSPARDIDATAFSPIHRCGKLPIHDFAGHGWISTCRQFAGSPLRSGRSSATLTPRGSLDCIAAARTTIPVSFTVALACGPSLPALRCVPACSSSRVRLSVNRLANGTTKPFLKGAAHGYQAETH